MSDDEDGLQFRAADALRLTLRRKFCVWVCLDWFMYINNRTNPSSVIHSKKAYFSPVTNCAIQLLFSYLKTITRIYTRILHKEKRERRAK
jgi:hypothetical protein